MPRVEETYYDHVSHIATQYKASGVYKTEAGALKNLLKKTKDLPYRSQAQDLLMCYHVYDKTAELIDTKQFTDRSKNATGYAAFEDINYEALTKEVNKQIPGVHPYLLKRIINWVIHWHYTR
ncbi:MAG: hypothetical protein V4580_03325 [Bacteroidota bacterium]